LFHAVVVLLLTLMVGLHVVLLEEVEESVTKLVMAISLKGLVFAMVLEY